MIPKSENRACGALAPAEVTHGKSVWVIGDYAHEMVGVAQDAGYQTGFVQLFHRSALARSHVSRELKR